MSVGVGAGPDPEEVERGWTWSGVGGGEIQQTQSRSSGGACGQMQGLIPCPIIFYGNLLVSYNNTVHRDASQAQLYCAGC